MALRLLCLMFCRVLGGLILLRSASAAKDAQILVLWHENAVLGRRNRQAETGRGSSLPVFDAVLVDAGIAVCKIPPRSPRVNAFAGRFVGTVRAEVTNRMLIFNQRYLRRTLDRYARHYNGRRPHRALQLQPSRCERPVIDLTLKRIKRRPVLGGLINEYDRAA
jgi:hypothetical protein